VHTERDPRLSAIPDIHGHAKGEHKPYAEERPLPLTARMLFLWFFHACRRGFPRFLMVTDHINYLTFEDPASVNLVRRALKLAQAGDLYGAAETANVDVGHAQTVSEGLRRGMRYSIGAEVDNDPRARPDAQNIVDAMRPDGLIRSVHFIPIDHPVHGPNWNWAFDNPEFAALFDHVGTEKTWEGYMAVLLDAIERLPGNIVGHFYVPAVFGHWPDQETLERYEDQLLDAVEPRGMAIEFNTRFLYRSESEEQKQRYLDANRRLLRKAKERGIGIAIGSDAHSPKDQAAAFDTVLAVLDELDINEIVFPIGGRLLRVALRYVKPAEPEPPPAPPAPPPRPEPVVAAVAAPADLPAVPSEPVEPVPAAAKPVRKARAGASSARPKETLPERTDARHADEAPFEPPAAATDAATPPAAAAPEPVPAPAPAPVTAKKPAAKKAKAAAPASPPEPEPEPVSSVVVPAPEPIAAPAPAPAPPPAPVIAKKTPKAPVRPAAKAAPKPVAKPAAKAAKAPKPATSTAKPLAVHAPAKSAAKTAAKAKPAAKAAPHAKAPAKKVAAKAAPAKRATRAAAKPAPAKKAAAKKAPAKKPARPAAKAPVKKTASKKPARDAGKRVPAKKTPPRKPAAKKAPVKKSAGKRK
jgi:HisJ family histidinol phosphate phosphatase